MGSFIICTHQQISLGSSDQGDEWAGHVALVGEGRKVYRVLVGKHEGKNHLEDRGINERMGLECIVG
jgi:hypothetical protein